MRKRLLIVDDEKSTRRLLEFLLTPYYDVVCLSDGSEALTWLSEGNNADVMITDYEMSEMNGDELLVLMRRSTILQDIPVIVISSHKAETLSATFDHLDVKAYLTKPIEPKTLFWRVEESLGTLVNY